MHHPRISWPVVGVERPQRRNTVPPPAIILGALSPRYPTLLTNRQAENKKAYHQALLLEYRDRMLGGRSIKYRDLRKKIKYG